MLFLLRYNKPEAVKQVTKTTFVFGTEEPFAGKGLSTDTTNRSYLSGTSYGIVLPLFLVISLSSGSENEGQAAPDT